MATREPSSTQPMTTSGAALIPWADARERLAAAQLYWFASVRPDGAPHVRPVLAVWWDGSMYSTSSPTARKATNLAANARCAITVRDPDMDLVLEGEATRVDDEATLEVVAATYLEKYGWPVTIRDGAYDAPYGAPTAGEPPYALYRVTPAAVFAFGTDDELGPRSTRFGF
jgi:nitroimidazol reductase NimA-like FMN-containing flavoprotein (pyridoxamine 5'-phosphate oxidase superfamily)